MGGWVEIEDYDVVEVGGYSVEALDDLVEDLHEQTRECAEINER